LKESGLKLGQWLVISGAGGGVGGLAIQYAKAQGFRVIGIDTSEGKRQLCMDLGCEAFIDFRETQDIPAEVKRITGRGAHCVLVTGGTPAAYANWWLLLRFGGRLVVVGLPPRGSTIAGAEPVTLCVPYMRLEVTESLPRVLNSLSVHASRVGTLRETEEALGIAAAVSACNLICESFNTRS
jgi:propanol-preferring alcohol dehydrogenase